MVFNFPSISIDIRVPVLQHLRLLHLAYMLMPARHLVYVETPHGEVLRVQGIASDTVAHLKARVQASLQIPTPLNLQGEDGKGNAFLEIIQVQTFDFVK